jgi:hypothetical protein
MEQEEALVAQRYTRVPPARTSSPTRQGADRARASRWADVRLSAPAQVNALQRRLHCRPLGAIAQLGERLDRTQEVAGSSPASSIPDQAASPPPPSGGEITRMKATFDRAGLFVWHRRVVEHEDHEMMRPYRIGQ